MSETTKSDTKADIAENSILSSAPRPRGGKDFAQEEVRLANRNHGFALELMRHDITPTGMHYLLNHFDIPHLPADTFRLSLEDGFENPMCLSIQQIKELPQVSIPVTFECAGNGRALHEDRNRSMPWHNEAVGTSLWTGTPLVNVLEMAGIPSDTKEIVFIGADCGLDKGVEHNFGRSLSLHDAMNPDILLVTQMNSMELLPQHGAPIRLIVPGWYGMTNVKWLLRMEAWKTPYDGFQQLETYRYRNSSDEEGIPVSEIRVKSLMIPPGIPDWYSRIRKVQAGNIAIEGRAWSGADRDIIRVEFSPDGETWHEATLGAKVGKYAWRAWSCSWEARAGHFTLRCRATDSDGNIQPLDAPWDVAGFGNNMAQQVDVYVV